MTTLIEFVFLPQIRWVLSGSLRWQILSKLQNQYQICHFGLLCGSIRNVTGTNGVQIIVGHSFVCFKATLFWNQLSHLYLGREWAQETRLLLTPWSGLMCLAYLLHWREYKKGVHISEILSPKARRLKRMLCYERERALWKEANWQWNWMSSSSWLDTL